MKNFKLSNLLFVALTSAVISLIATLNFFATFTVLAVAGQVMYHFKTSGGTVLQMAVTKEIWENDIIGNLFKNNDFATRAVNADQFVVAGKIVHIPNAGAPTASVKNNTTFPLNAVKRADSDILYSLDTYYQPPKFVEKVEQYELSYDKRQSIMGEQQNQLIDDAMDGLLFRWHWSQADLTSTLTTPINYILTVGSSISATLAGATGNRKSFTKDAFSAVKKAMDKAKIPPTGRLCLLTADMHQQFIDSLSDTALTNFYRVADPTKGIIGEYMGFTVYMRSTVGVWRAVTANSVTTIMPVDTQASDYAAATGDFAGSLFWQESCVERARGEVNVFDDAGRPEYYGDVFSMNMRLGGRIRRMAGIYAVIEDVAA